MAIGKSFNKLMFFVFVIVLVVSAFSGCVDVDSPDTTDEAVIKFVKEHQPLSKIQTDFIKGGNLNIKETEGGNCREFNVEKNRYKICDTSAPRDGTANIALKNGDVLAESPDSEASSPQTQLSGEPATDEPAAAPADANLVDFSGMTPEEAYRAAIDCPDCLVGQPIDMFIIDDPLVKEKGKNIMGVFNKDEEEFAKKHDEIDNYHYDVFENNKKPRKVSMGKEQLKQLIMVEDTDGDGLINNYGVSNNGNVIKNF